MLCINVCLYLVCLIVYRVMAHMHVQHLYLSSFIFKYVQITFRKRKRANVMLKYFKYRMAPISVLSRFPPHMDQRNYRATQGDQQVGQRKEVDKKCVCFFCYGEKILEFLVFIMKSVCGSLACEWIYAFGGGHALQRWDCSIGDSPQRCCCQICVFSSIL